VAKDLPAGPAIILLIPTAYLSEFQPELISATSEITARVMSSERSQCSLYQTLKEDQIFTDTELHEIQARLLLTDKTFGGIVDDQHPSVYRRDDQGH
jgi:hypothetical protein